MKAEAQGTIVFTVAVIGFALFVYTRIKHADEPAVIQQRHAEETEKARARTHILADTVHYMKDPRTNLCFAYVEMWSGQTWSYSIAGPVDCQFVANHLDN